MDSNGWPQAGRNKALDTIRRSHALMYAGDQHLASIVQHGIDEHGDAGFSFCVPSIAAGYPRSWRPDKEGRSVVKRINGLANTGDYKEGFGNRVSVHAIANPEKKNRRPILELLHDKASGHGLVTVDRAAGTMKLECFKLLFDARAPRSEDQFPGWPKTINIVDNYGRQAVSWLPKINVSGLTHKPVFQVYDSKGQLVYALRSPKNSFTAKVFESGEYTVKIGNPDTHQWKTLKLKSTQNKDTVKVDF